MDIFWEAEQVLSTLAWECAVNADKARESDDDDEIKESCVLEYERAREEIDSLRFLVRSIGLHKGETKYRLGKDLPGDRLFRESYDRLQYKISAHKVKDRSAFLRQADYKSAALDILQMGFDRLDAAILFDKVKLNAVKLSVKFLGRTVPKIPSYLATLRDTDTFIWRRGAASHGLGERLLDPEDFYIGLRLVSFYQRHAGFKEATMSEWGGDDTIAFARRGDLSDFKREVESQRRSDEAYYLATNYHRADWYEYALTETEAYYRERKGFER